jgi:transposase
MELSDKQWEKIKDLVPEGVRRSDGKGRPWRDKREVLDGILWIVRTGAPWKDLPERYPPYQTCHRRFQQWVESGVFDKVIEALASDLQQRGKIDLSECFIDGSFSLAKRGAHLWEKLSEVKAPRSWQSQTLLVLFYLSQSNLQALMK